MDIIGLVMATISAGWFLFIVDVDAEIASGVDSIRNEQKIDEIAFFLAEFASEGGATEDEVHEFRVRYLEHVAQENGVRSQLETLRVVAAVVFGIGATTSVAARCWQYSIGAHR